MRIVFDLGVIELPALEFLLRALERVKGDDAPLVKLVDSVAQPLWRELRRRRGGRNDASPVSIEVPIEVASAAEISRLGAPLLEVPSKPGDGYWHFGSSFCLLLVAHLNAVVLARPVHRGAAVH